MAPATAILLLLSLATPLLALSSTSPQDLSAYGKYRVVLGTTGVLNDTIHALLDSTPLVRPFLPLVPSQLIVISFPSPPTLRLRVT
jgi:hypothetical protein